jgi:hypothetical protein
MIRAVYPCFVEHHYLRYSKEKIDVNGYSKSSLCSEHDVFLAEFHHIDRNLPVWYLYSLDNESVNLSNDKEVSPCLIY